MRSKIITLTDIGQEDSNKTLKQTALNDLNLDENANGFATQLDYKNNKENDSLMTEIDSLKENSKNNPSTSIENVLENNSKNYKSLNKEYDFIIPSLDSLTNSSFSLMKQLNSLKNESKKSFDTFPHIQIEKAKYYKKNLFDRNIYVKYLNKKIQSETKIQHKAFKHTQNQEMIFNTRRTGKLKNNSYNYELSSSENFVGQVEKNLENEKYSSIIMPIKPSFKIKISKQLKHKTESITNAKKIISENNRNEIVKPDCSETQMREANQKNSSRKIIDLNLISNESILSSHYMNQPLQKFADLKLNEKWPSSNMYKFSIQNNSWVRSFKEKSIDNEIKTNFRHISMDELKKTHLLVYLPSRTETKASTLLFPNIKQISFQYCE